MLSRVFFLISVQLLATYAFNIKSLYKGNTMNSVLFYPGKFNSQLPPELYSTFLSYVNKKDISVFISQDKENNCKVISNDLKDFKNCIVAHSFSANDAIELFSECEDINKLVLIDPLDDQVIKINMPTIKMPTVEIPGFEMPKFEIQKMWDEFENSVDIDKLNKKMNDFYKIEDIIEKKETIKDLDDSDLEIEPIVDASVVPKEKQVLIVRTGESNKWRFFPSVPPIGIFNLKNEKINFENKNEITINNFGHFDILDETWADIANKFFSKGANNRDVDNLDNFRDSLSNSINTFLNYD